MVFDFGSEILTLDIDFLGEEGFGGGVGWRRQNGQVKLSFQTLEPKLVSDTPRLSYTTMITVVQTN